MLSYFDCSQLTPAPYTVCSCLLLYRQIVYTQLWSSLHCVTAGKTQRARPGTHWSALSHSCVKHPAILKRSHVDRFQVFTYWNINRSPDATKMYFYWIVFKAGTQTWLRACAITPTWLFASWFKVCIYCRPWKHKLVMTCGLPALHNTFLVLWTCDSTTTSNNNKLNYRLSPFQQPQVLKYIHKTN